MLIFEAFLIAAVAALVCGVFCSHVPRIRSWRAGATMPVGGACVALVTLATLWAWIPMFVSSHGPRLIAWSHLMACVAIAALFVALCILRLLNAARWELVLVVLGASGFVVWQGVQIESVKVPFRAEQAALGSLGPIVTVVWLVGLAWLFGGAHEVPGWHFGSGATVAFTILSLAMLEPQAQHHVFVVLASAILCGACAGGFLPSLRSPTFAAGQAGSLTLGFCLAIITVLGALKNTAFLIMLLPLLLVGAPLIDFSFALFAPSPLTPPPAGEGKGVRGFSFTEAREPLHRALIRHGWKPVRVTFLYLAIETYLCALAILLVLLIRLHFTIKLLVLIPFLAFGWFFFTSIVKLLARPEGFRAHGSGFRERQQRVELHDVRISAVTMVEAVAQIESFIGSRQPHMVVTSDASAIVRSQEDEQLHQIINEADLVTPDGIGVIWSARFLDLPLYERVSGVDLAVALADLSAQKGYSVYLLGAAPGVAEEAAANLQGRFHGLRIAGARHGYFPAEEEVEIVRQIREAHPDILLVAFGIPKQEKWIKRYLHELQVPVCIGVGGSFDVYAGRVPRAPVWMQRLGLEWLYRTVRNPRRISRALLLPRLVLLTLKRRFKRAQAPAQWQ